MLSLGVDARVVLATEPVDLRRGHDGLISLLRCIRSTSTVADA